MRDPELEKTIEFVLMFNKFFDCLNVSCLDAGRHSRNAFKSPYHSTKDFRINVRSISHNIIIIVLIVCVCLVAEGRISWLFGQVGEECIG